jgi:hypothetical protein
MDNNEAKKLHVVTVKFRAGEQPGRIQTPIKIVTDRDNRGASLMASATVVAPAAAPAVTPASASEPATQAAQLDKVQTAATP